MVGPNSLRRGVLSAAGVGLWVVFYAVGDALDAFFHEVSTDIAQRL